ncbi:ABC transporter substrate-binding protein [Paenibacillus daejeonensis]|uniref:ABC transporter substrate-binding protein n=1 Tax=Paenibacillus daejeonensis TaxID=135193 RepID=UPI00037230E7|nr:ABC transporter substrate-binding protein [Paenibacillus daejeonensis]
MEQGRFRIGMLLGVAVLLLLLSACGGGNESASGTAEQNNNSSRNVDTSGGTPDTQTEEQSSTKLVTDDLGREVEVPTAPERIVAGEFASELLELGITPVGAGDNSFKIVYTQDAMAGVTPIGDPPNLEVLLELEPDLVIAPTVFQEIYPEQMEQVDKIAPIYYLSFDQDPIYGIFTKLAGVVGKEGEAQSWIEAYEAEAAAAQEQIHSALGDETVSIFRVEKGRLRIYLNRNFAGYMLRSGLQAPAPELVAAEIEKNPFGSAVEISLEMLPDYAGDHLLLIVRSEGDDQDAFAEIEQLELWKNLPAVKNGNVHRLETDKYYGSDIVTIRETMKETAAMLAGE